MAKKSPAPPARSARTRRRTKAIAPHVDAIREKLARLHSEPREFTLALLGDHTPQSIYNRVEQAQNQLELLRLAAWGQWQAEIDDDDRERRLAEPPDWGAFYKTLVDVQQAIFDTAGEYLTWRLTEAVKPAGDGEGAKA